MPCRSFFQFIRAAAFFMVDFDVVALRSAVFQAVDFFRSSKIDRRLSPTLGVNLI